MLCIHFLCVLLVCVFSGEIVSSHSLLDTLYHRKRKVSVCVLMYFGREKSRFFLSMLGVLFIVVSWESHAGKTSFRRLYNMNSFASHFRLEKKQKKPKTCVIIFVLIVYDIHMICVSCKLSPFLSAWKESFLPMISMRGVRVDWGSRFGSALILSTANLNIVSCCCSSKANNPPIFKLAGNVFTEDKITAMISSCRLEDMTKLLFFLSMIIILLYHTLESCLVN